MKEGRLSIITLTFGGADNLSRFVFLLALARASTAVNVLILCGTKTVGSCKYLGRSASHFRSELAKIDNVWSKDSRLAQVCVGWYAYVRLGNGKWVISRQPRL